ncbi:MAG: sugar transferase [Actinobacteria bacterium]|nr:sugar transferase [Actinomycetota bacterium]
MPSAALTRLTASATALAAALNCATGGRSPAANWATRGSSCVWAATSCVRSSLTAPVQGSAETVASKVFMASHIRVLPAALKNRLAKLHLGGTRVITAEFFAESVFGKILLRDVDEEWVLDRELNLTQNANYARLKSILDRGMALLLLVFFLPIILLTALAILVTDGRPVFYIQKRCGLRGEIFKLLKFRTMKNRKEAGEHYTGERDERVTRIGRWLRPSRLDEVPQLWNILVGEMSLIGPRAEWDKLVKKYEQEIPFYSIRHEVPPGLTGWAQVNYPYGSNLEDTREKLRYDLYYIRNHSFLLDFQIVLKTIYVVLAKVGGK